jgi:hypothetical protein
MIPTVGKFVVVATVALMPILAGCTSAVSPARTTAKVGPVVHWADEPATSSLISSLVKPSPLPQPQDKAPPCTFSELSTARLAIGAATQDLVISIWFRNNGPRACTVTGRPKVVAAATGQPTVVAVAEGVPSYGELADIAPGGTVSEQIDDPLACATDPGGSTRKGDSYDSLAITIPGGITKSVRVSLSLPCGMWATPFFTPKPEPTYPDQLWGVLIPHLRLPAMARGGSTLHFEVDLSNPKDQPIALSPCPVYLEYSDIAGKLLYRLNCRTVHLVPAHGQVRYEMEMAIPQGAPSGLAEVWWSLLASLHIAHGQVRVQGP